MKTYRDTLVFCLVVPLLVTTGMAFIDTRIAHDGAYASRCLLLTILGSSAGWSLGRLRAKRKPVALFPRAFDEGRADQVDFGEVRRNGAARPHTPAE